MKSILMSIKPKWVEKIANGEKTVEVRKSVPKCDTPFKVYMYETRDGGHSCKRCKETSETCYSWAKRGVGCYNGRGKVVGEFICDHIIDLSVETVKTDHSENGGILWNTVLKNACIENDDLVWYLDIKDGYGLHISDLKIYDKPKELSEFKSPCFSCAYDSPLFDKKPCKNCSQGQNAIIARPPKSWCYVEEL